MKRVYFKISLDIELLSLLEQRQNSKKKVDGVLIEERIKEIEGLFKEWERKPEVED